MVYSPKKGLVWAVGPMSCLFNLVLGGLFFVKPIRSRNYVTLMDPFQNKYGQTVAAFIFIPALIADIICALALLLRALIGEPLIGLPDLLPLPWDKTQEDGHRQRLFPFRTAIMLVAIVALVAVSRLALWLSDKGLLKKKLRGHEGDANMLYMAPVSTDVEETGPKLSCTTKKADGLFTSHGFV